MPQHCLVQAAHCSASTSPLPSAEWDAQHTIMLKSDLTLASVANTEHKTCLIITN